MAEVFQGLCTASVAFDGIATALVRPDPVKHPDEHMIIKLARDRIEFVTGKVYRVTFEELP
jgi:hypothetical protein